MAWKIGLNLHILLPRLYGPTLLRRGSGSIRENMSVSVKPLAVCSIRAPSVCELRFRIDRFPRHLHDIMIQVSVPQIRFLAPDHCHHFEGKLQMTAFVT